MLWFPQNNTVFLFGFAFYFSQLGVDEVKRIGDARLDPNFEGGFKYKNEYHKLKFIVG